MSIGIKIKEERKKRKLTQLELAKQFNISEGTISMWETNKRTPDIETIKKIANYFNITTDELLEQQTETKSTQNRIKKYITIEEDDWINLLNELTTKYGKDFTENITEALWKLIQSKDKENNNG